MVTMKDAYLRTTAQYQYKPGEKRINEAERRAKLLDSYYQLVKHVVLPRQSATLGLHLTASHRSPEVGRQDAWVRDNVYTAMGIWCLALAYRKIDNDKGRRYELEQSVIKCMRGLLFCFMKQASKVECFKTTQLKEHALHAKYDWLTGDPVVNDNEWGHLQIDATSLYILFLAQATSSGLTIIYDSDEVAFIQNMIYYIERAYRTPDYGMWERGNKANIGHSELNTSSIGMAKAALEAINGVDLFGDELGHSVHVDADAHNRNRAIMKSLLPKESSSKETDAALLFVASFPAFAVEDAGQLQETKDRIVATLEGKYGMKRFLRDGYQTVVEDPGRMHYQAAELKQFDGIECEWPIFFVLMILDGLFRNNPGQVAEYRGKLDPLLVLKAGKQGTPEFKMLPELYKLEEDSLEAERMAPGSQKRVASNNVPFMWGQSLLLIADLIQDGLITIEDVDPTRRHLVTSAQMPIVRPSMSFNLVDRKDLVVQIALISETPKLQSQLAMYGIQTQTRDEIEPILVCNPALLVEVYTHLGKSTPLHLSGRPGRPFGSLGTSKAYRIQGQMCVFYPLIIEQLDFYMTMDEVMLTDMIKEELAFVRNNWMMNSRPLITIMLREDRVRGSAFNAILHLISEFKKGECNGVQIRLGRLQQLIFTSFVEELEVDSSIDVKSILLKKRKKGKYHRHHFEVLKSQFRITDGRGDAKAPGLRREMSIAPRYGGMMTMVKPTDMASEQIFLRKKSLRRKTSKEAGDELNSSLQRRDSQSKDGLAEATGSFAALTILREARDKPDLDALNQMSSDDLTALLKESWNIFEQGNIVQVLVMRHGQQYRIHFDTAFTDEDQPSSSIKNVDVDLHTLIKEVYFKAAKLRVWATVRQMASLLTRLVDSLAPAITEMLVRGKEVTLGEFGHEEYIISEPITPAAIQEVLFSRCRYDIREACLQQELVLHLGRCIINSPALFEGMLRIRIGWIVEAMKNQISRIYGTETATLALMSLSPSEMKAFALELVSLHLKMEPQRRSSAVSRDPSVGSSGDEATEAPVGSVSKLSVSRSFDDDSSRYLIGGVDEIRRLAFNIQLRPINEDEFLHKRARQLAGSLNRVPPTFYRRVWNVLSVCEGGGLKLRDDNLPYYPIIPDTTPGEKNFALRVESLLNRIHLPEYRAIIIESLMILANITERNPEIRVSQFIDLEEIINRAVNLFRLTYDDPNTVLDEVVFSDFYDLKPTGKNSTATYIARAIAELLSPVLDVSDNCAMQ
eukprot:Clim_evm23s3 gene=Clim_evmTU23s3